MPKPRADFSCKKCATTHEDLPVDSIRCPYSGAKRGFTRLFNAVNVGMSKTGEVDQVLTKTLEPQFAEHSERKAGAGRHAKVLEEGFDRQYTKASPQERQRMMTQTPPAAGALGMIPGPSRTDSRTLNYPALTNKRVRPIFEN